MFVFLCLQPGADHQEHKHTVSRVDIGVLCKLLFKLLMVISCDVRLMLSIICMWLSTQPGADVFTPLLPQGPMLV